MSTPAFREFWAGVRTLAPLLVGVAPFGMIYGVLALANGLTPAAAQAMSAILFAGSAQFLLCQLFGAGAPVTGLAAIVIAAVSRSVLWTLVGGFAVLALLGSSN